MTSEPAIRVLDRPPSTSQLGESVTNSAVLFGVSRFHVA